MIPVRWQRAGGAQASCVSSSHEMGDVPYPDRAPREPASTLLFRASSRRWPRAQPPLSLLIQFPILGSPSSLAEPRQPCTPECMYGRQSPLSAPLSSSPRPRTTCHRQEEVGVKCRAADHPVQTKKRLIALPAGGMSPIGHPGAPLILPTTHRTRGVASWGIGESVRLSSWTIAPVALSLMRAPPANPRARARRQAIFLLHMAVNAPSIPCSRLQSSEGPQSFI